MACNVLITGISGFLGKSAAIKFHSLGYSVYGLCRDQSLDNLSQDYISIFTRLISCPEISVETLKSFDISFDFIFHFSGNSSVYASTINPDLSFNSTVTPLFALLEYIRLHSPLSCIVYPSSAAVYGSCSDSLIYEKQCFNPVSPYGYHKQLSELLLEQYAHLHNVRSICIRFFSIYGVGLQKQLIHDVCCKSVDNIPITFYGTGQETRDWIYVDDALSLILFLISIPASDLPIFFVSNGASGIRTSNDTLIPAILNRLNFQSTYQFIGKTRIGDPNHYWADISTLSKLGWSPKVSLDEGLDRYVEWFSTLNS